MIKETFKNSTQKPLKISIKYAYYKREDLNYKIKICRLAALREI